MSKPVPGMTGRMWLGYWLVLMSPAIGWVLEDTMFIMRKYARLVTIIVLFLGVLMTRPPPEQ